MICLCSSSKDTPTGLTWVYENIWFCFILKSNYNYLIWHAKRLSLIDAKNERLQMRSLGCFLFFRLVWLQSCNFSAKSVETIFFISAFRFPFPFAACNIFTACWFQLCKQTQSISIFAIYLRCRQVKDVRRHGSGRRSRILPFSLSLHDTPHPHPYTHTYTEILLITQLGKGTWMDYDVLCHFTIRWRKPRIHRQMHT